MAAAQNWFAVAAVIAVMAAAGAGSWAWLGDFALGIFRGLALTPADDSLPEMRILADRFVARRAGGAPTAP